MFWHPRVPGFNGWSLGKHLSTMIRNFLPTLFLTLPSHGCLYHVIFYFPWMVVPCDLYFPIFALSCCLPCLGVGFKVVVADTLFKRLLV